MKVLSIKTAVTFFAVFVAGGATHWSLQKIARVLATRKPKAEPAPEMKAE